MIEIKLKRLGPENLPQLKELINLFNHVFETKQATIADDAHLTKLLSQPGFIAIVTLANEKIVGGLTAYELPSYQGNFSEAYIYDIAVDSDHQRRGLGTMLIDALKDHCKSHNIKTAFVEAHEEDIHALDFYRGTGAEEEKVAHFNYYPSNK